MLDCNVDQALHLWIPSNDTAVRHVKTKSMFTAFDQNLPGVVTFWILSGSDIHSRRRSDKRTAMQLAVQHQWVAIIELLKDMGVDPTKVRSLDNGDSLLHQAIREGANMRVIQTLLDLKLDVNDVNHLRETALHLAVKNTRLVRLLLSRAATVDQKTLDKKTPLHLAAIHNSVSSAKMLVEAHASIGARDLDGHSPMDYAAQMYPGTPIHALLAPYAFYEMFNARLHDAMDKARAQA